MGVLAPLEEGRAVSTQRARPAQYRAVAQVIECFAGLLLEAALLVRPRPERPPGRQSREIARSPSPQPEDHWRGCLGVDAVGLVYYYQSGQLWMTMDAVAGEFEGPFERYHRNGELWVKGVYEAGERDGPYELYRDSGRLEEKGTYRADERHGVFESYHENGQLAVRGTYDAGVRHGPYAVYDDDGRLIEEGAYENGRPVGSGS